MAALTIEGIEVNDVTLSAPDITQLTSSSIDGTGVFDLLMKAGKLHLQEEYNNDRITGQEYTTVYIGMMTAVLQQSIAYLVQHQNQEKVIAEIGLLRQKTATELAQTDDTLPVGLGFNGDSAVEGLIKSKKDLDALQADLATSQIEKSDREVALLGQKIITELGQTDTNISTAAQEYALNDSTDILGKVKAEYDRTTNEASLVLQKLVTEVSNTSDTKPQTLGEMSSTTVIAGLAGSQKEKTDAEVTLLAQKANTELAQTDSLVKTGTPYLNTSTSVTGIVQKQKDLFQAQTDGFARDAEQKAAKLVLDTWSVSETMGDGTGANATNHLQDADVGALVTILKAGVGA